MIKFILRIRDTIRGFVSSYEALDLGSPLRRLVKILMWTIVALMVFGIAVAEETNDPRTLDQLERYVGLSLRNLGYYCVTQEGIDGQLRLLAQDLRYQQFQEQYSVLVQNGDCVNTSPLAILVKLVEPLHTGLEFKPVPAARVDLWEAEIMATGQTVYITVRRSPFEWEK